MSDLTRWLDKVKCDQKGCWIWQGGIQKRTGYGITMREGLKVNSHRAVYEAMVESIPTRIVLHHECGEPACCNPQRLAAMTNSQHRKLHTDIEPLRTHCPNGHEYNDENTGSDPRGGRRCLQCHRLSKERHLEAHREREKERSRRRWREEPEYRAYHQAYNRTYRQRKKDNQASP